MTGFPLRLVGLLILLLALGLAPLAARAQDDFGDPAPGHRVYDTTGLLTLDEIAMLEGLAAGVEDAGAPVVVYHRAKDASYEETVDDARALMDAWDVQSAPDARDGVVLFFNADPDDLRHGEYAVVAGAALLDGNLPQRELERIADEMLGPLADERTAEGIATGLREIEDSLRNGPPPPPEPNAFERFAARMTDGPLSVVNIVGVLVGIGATIGVLRLWPRRRPTPVIGDLHSVAIPQHLPPAWAGALVTGGVADQQMLGTLLDLARRGAIAIEPAEGKNSKKQAQVRLLDAGQVTNEVERAVWDALAKNAEDGVVPAKRLGKVRGEWQPGQEALKRDMVARGWFAPEPARRLRWRFGIQALGMALLAVGALVLTIAGAHPLAAVGTGALFVAALLAFVAAVSVTDISPDGDAAAAEWIAYRELLKRSRKQRDAPLDLDRDMPYAVAMGAGSALDKPLKEASREGYAPAWLSPSLRDQGAWGEAGFYPYWVVFNTAVTPSSSGTTGTGASAGSGAAGGSY